jgi:hypothetical protein
MIVATQRAANRFAAKRRGDRSLPPESVWLQNIAVLAGAAL